MAGFANSQGSGRPLELIQPDLERAALEPHLAVGKVVVPKTLKRLIEPK
jgi:hypothetical protein